MIRIIKNISGKQKLIKDLGIFFEIEEEFDLVSMLDFDYIIHSQNLFDGIANGDFSLIIDGDEIITDSQTARDCFSPITKTNTTSFSLNNLELINPTQAQFFIIANTLNLAFHTHAEKVILESNLQNVFVFFGIEYNKLLSWENISLSDGAIVLDTISTDTIIDNCDSLINITSFDNADHIQLSICSDPNFILTGSTSLKINRKAKCCKNEHIFLKAVNFDWSNITHIKYQLFGNGGEKIRFYINSEQVPQSDIVVKAGWQEIVVDITGMIKNNVTNYGFGILSKAITTDFNTYIDSIRQATMNSYYNTGHVITKTISTNPAYEIATIFLFSYANIPQDTTILYKISIDDGEHWHIITDLELAKWVNVAEWEENFTCRNKLKIKVELTTENVLISPIVDDFFIFYKLT